MITLDYSGDIMLERTRLAQAQDDISETIRILQDITTADIVDFLFYNKKEEYFYDKVKKNKISQRYLKDGTISMLGKAYNMKTPYHSLYTLYDKNYNISIDNPHKESISAQIILPIVQQNIVIGIIRFSRHKYTFESFVLKKLLLLKESLIDIFITHDDIQNEANTKRLFNLKNKKIYKTLDNIRFELDTLYENANDPEIKKLIDRAEESIESIRHYMKPNILKEKMDDDENTYTSIRVLIADDIEINVKILQAMLGAEDTYDITSASDGIEAIEKINTSDRDGKYIHILFLDHHMPGKLGLEVAKIIRENEKKHMQKQNADIQEKMVTYR
jgi:CheY-like chemotaxis protein